jgi:hypothetical protein
MINEIRARTTENIIPVPLLILPEAKGLFLFFGCSRSCSISTRSLIIYKELLKKQKTIKATRPVIYHDNEKDVHQKLKLQK